MPYRKASRNIPTMAERHAARTAEARRPDAVVTAIDLAEARAARAEINRQPWALRHPYAALLLFLAFVGFAGWFPPNDANASPCYEDMPCFVWSKGGNGQRGVILRSAPAHCTWKARQDGCITVVSVRRYCRLRRAHRIDIARTAHLKGDGYARDHGC